MLLDYRQIIDQCMYCRDEVLSSSLNEIRLISFYTMYSEKLRRYWVSRNNNYLKILMVMHKKTLHTLVRKQLRNDDARLLSTLGFSYSQC